MHRGLSSVMMNYARSISDEKKAKTIVKGNKSGEITGSSDDMQAVSYTHLTLPTIYSV